MVTLILVVALLFAFGTTAFAGGHHGGGNRSGHHGGTYRKIPAVTWHKETQNYTGHYSDQCVQHDHAWHVATDDYYGHYSYSCIDYSHNYYHDDCNSLYHH